MKFTILYFYPKLLNLYGDNGNVEILASRAKSRGYDVEVHGVGVGTKLTESMMSQANVVFMGGGPDSKQKTMYSDLIQDKGPYLRNYINLGGVGLYICGSYQLLGKYYKSADGDILDGLGVFDLYTEHFGNKKPRCIGNTVATLNDTLTSDPVFKLINHLGDSIVGFENHGGRTYLGENMIPLAKIKTGHGNNSEDGTEGVIFNNSLGTYFHGPLLSKNPHVADYLIAKGLGVNNLDELNDSLIFTAHAASKKLKQ